jgi:hypothetical protein
MVILDTFIKTYATIILCHNLYEFSATFYHFSYSSVQFVVNFQIVIQYLREFYFMIVRLVDLVNTSKS